MLNLYNQVFNLYVFLQDNYVKMKSLVDELKANISKVTQGGGEKSIQRHLSQGKMLVRERITTLLDPG